MGEKPQREVPVYHSKTGFMGIEAVTILVALAGWGGVTFGFQFLLKIIASDPAGESLLTRFTFFNLPFHVWFTGQFLPLWFIFLCLMFNLNMDRLTERHNRKRYPYEYE
jgi:putative solute:sodium symporter small subunit